MCDKRDRTITCVFCGNLHLTLIFSSLLHKVCRLHSSDVLLSFRQARFPIERERVAFFSIIREIKVHVYAKR